MRQTSLANLEEINEQLKTALLSGRESSSYLQRILKKISTSIQCNTFGLVSRGHHSLLSIYGDPNKCLFIESENPLKIFRKLIKIKKYMSWNSTQWLKAGFNSTKDHSNETLHYFPLIHGRTTLGFTLFRGQPIKSEYISLLERIMTHIAVAYRLQSKQEDLTLMKTRFSLNKLLQGKIETHEPDQLIALSCPIISKHFSAERTTFFAYNAHGDILQSIHAEGLHDPIVVRKNEGLVGSCLKTKHTFFTNQPYDRSDFSKTVDQTTGFLTKSALVTPLIVGDNFFGVLQVLNSTRKFNDLDTKHIQTISRTLSSHLNTFKFMRENLATQTELKSLLETIPEVLYRLDENGNFLFVSQEIIKWGYMREDLIGGHFKDIIHSDDFKNIARDAVLPKYTGKTTGDKRAPGLFDERRSGKRGTKLIKVRIIPGPHVNFKDLYPNLPKNYEACFYTEVNASGYWTKDYSSNPKFNGTIGIISDITDKYFAEQKLESAQRDLIRAERFAGLGTLAAGIAHDFNNILAAIGLSSEVASAMLKKGETNDKIFTNLKNIGSYVEKASDLTSRLLTLGRSNISKVESTNIQQVIDDAMGIMKHQLETRGIDVNVQVLGNSPTCYLDRGQLRDALINLTANSMHAMEEELSNQTESKSQMRFSIVAKHTENEIIINVLDTGTGIDKEILPRIFDPFFSTKNRDSRKGTGLGLAMVFSVIKSHGGRIHVQTATRKEIISSDPVNLKEKFKQQVLGVGTKISIFLPIHKSNNDLMKPISDEKNETYLKNSIIYLVDDEKAITELMTTILKSAGYRNVTNFRNGNEAMQAINSIGKPPDVIITDVQMPPLDGVKLCETLVKKFIRDQPSIIVLSGKLSDDYIQIFKSLGIREFLKKPCSGQDLLNALNRCLKNNLQTDKAD